MKRLLILLFFLPFLSIAQRYHKPKHEFLGPHQICPNLTYTYQGIHSIGVDFGAIGFMSGENFLGLKVGGAMHLQNEYRSYRLRTGLVYQRAVTDIVSVGARAFISRHPRVGIESIVFSSSVGFHLGVLQFYYGLNTLPVGASNLKTHTLSVIIGH